MDDLEAMDLAEPVRSMTLSCMEIAAVRSESGQGAIPEFGYLLETTSTSHVTLCDQDDAWRPGRRLG